MKSVKAFFAKVKNYIKNSFVSINTISEIADVTILLNQILYLAKDYTVFDLDKRLNDNIEYKLN